MSMSVGKAGAEMNEPNMTPFIDVLLVLLVVPGQVAQADDVHRTVPQRYLAGDHLRGPEAAPPGDGDHGVELHEAFHRPDSFITACRIVQLIRTPAGRQFPRSSRRPSAPGPDAEEIPR